jgi:hypothetical protein
VSTTDRDGVTRTRGDVSCLVEWPRGSLDWEDLSSAVRNRIRDHMDAVCDLVYGDAS